MTAAANVDAGRIAIVFSDIGRMTVHKARTLTLPVPPSANVWWRHVVIKKRVCTLLSKGARDYKASVAKLATGTVFEGPVAVEIDWYRARRSGDLDKRIGILLDSIQNVLIRNDEQVVSITARRHDDPTNPRIVVTVTPIGER